MIAHQTSTQVLDKNKNPVSPEAILGIDTKKAKGHAGPKDITPLSSAELASVFGNG